MAIKKTPGATSFEEDRAKLRNQPSSALMMQQKLRQRFTSQQPQAMQAPAPSIRGPAPQAKGGAAGGPPLSRGGMQNSTGQAKGPQQPPPQYRQPPMTMGQPPSARGQPPQQGAQQPAPPGGWQSAPQQGGTAAHGAGQGGLWYGASAAPKPTPNSTPEQIAAQNVQGGHGAEAENAWFVPPASSVGGPPLTGGAGPSATANAQAGYGSTASGMTGAPPPSSGTTAPPPPAPGTGQTASAMGGNVGQAATPVSGLDDSYLDPMYSNDPEWVGILKDRGILREQIPDNPGSWDAQTRELYKQFVARKRGQVADKERADREQYFSMIDRGPPPTLDRAQLDQLTNAMRERSAAQRGRATRGLSEALAGQGLSADATGGRISEVGANYDMALNEQVAQKEFEVQLTNLQQLTNYWGQRHDDAVRYWQQAKSEEERRWAAQEASKARREAEFAQKRLMDYQADIEDDVTGKDVLGGIIGIGGGAAGPLIGLATSGMTAAPPGGGATPGGPGATAGAMGAPAYNVGQELSQLGMRRSGAATGPEVNAALLRRSGRSMV